MADLNVQTFEVTGPANTTVFSVGNTGVVSENLGLTVTAGGETITAGGLTVTAGGLTVTAGGATISAGGLTVSAGTTALLGALLQLGIDSAATPTGAGQTITTGSIISRNAPSGACTAAILAAGTQNGQIVIVTNEATTVANTITFSTTLATGLVFVDATPTAVVIKAASAKMFIWISSLNSGNGAWVPIPPAAG